jgi:hypothetical protein
MWKVEERTFRAALQRKKVEALVPDCGAATLVRESAAEWLCRRNEGVPENSFGNVIKDMYPVSQLGSHGLLIA